MSKLWLSDGKLVMESGKLVLCDDCPCTGTGTPTTCFICVGSDTSYWVSVSLPQLIDNVCTGCSGIFGTYVLPSSVVGGYGCSWSKVFPLSLSGIWCFGDPELTVTAYIQSVVIDTVYYHYIGVQLTRVSGVLIADWRNLLGTGLDFTIDCSLFVDYPLEKFQQYGCIIPEDTGTSPFTGTGTQYGPALITFL